jgi:hypothetical protein
MIAVIKYEIVLNQLIGQGLICNYPNGGAFGFPGEVKPLVKGWIGPEDSTIRQGVLSKIRSVKPPYELTLAGLLVRAWSDLLPGKIWVMPGTHWSFELRHGSREWLPDLIRGVGLDPEVLAARTDGAAIEFSPEETDALRRFAGTLLGKLDSSDFFAAFTGWPAICTLHHHKQIWWVTPDAELLAGLDNLCAQ